MSFFKRVKRQFFKAIFSLDKTAAFYAMRSMYYDGMVRRLNDSSHFTWEEFDTRKAPKKFEDLMGLFFCSPLSRGILRQDIDEAALLYRYVSSVPNAHGVEVGRYYGGSTVMLATAIGEHGKLYSIDIAPKDKDRELISVIEKLGFTTRVELIIGDANKIDVNEALDFVFIDGDHSYEGARLDHNKWGGKLKTGGYLIHHDMSNTRRHSVQWNDLGLLFQSILRIQSSCLEVVDQQGSMVVFRKTSANWINLPQNNKLNVNTEGKQSRGNSYLNKEEKS